MQSSTEITNLPCSTNGLPQPRTKCRSLQEDKPSKERTIQNINGPHLDTPVHDKMDTILMTFQFQWMWIHWYSVESNVPTQKTTKTATRRKAGASIMIKEDTWHANAQRRNNKLDNLANRVHINLRMTNYASNLKPHSKRSLSDRSLWDKDSERRINSATSHRSELHILKMPKNRRMKTNKNTLNLWLCALLNSQTTNENNGSKKCMTWG